MQYILAYQSKSHMHLIRKQMVQCALKHGNQAAAEEYECHRNTVSKWVNRFKKEGPEGLKNRSRAPHHIPHKIIDPAIIDDICKKRDKEGYSANRLKMQFDLKPSNMAINRILHENNKVHPRRKKWQKTEDLWPIKQFFKTLETKLQLDGKQLTDIPNYYPYYKVLGLPKWQFTLRDVKSGGTFLGYMRSENGINACVFMVYVFEHFKRYGIDLSKVTIQIDAASYAQNLRSLKKTQFRQLIEDVYGAKLKIVPGGKTKQSDVESFHNLIEQEFYDRQSFSSVQDFYLKAYKYIHNFNFIRKNSHKDWKTPLYYLNQDRPDTSPEVLDLPPIYLDNHPDMYWCKINPKHITLQELQALDIHPEELPCEDFSPDEILADFARRVSEGYSKANFSAHDLPIYPRAWWSIG